MKSNLLCLLIFLLIMTFPSAGICTIIFEDDFSNDGGWVAADTSHTWKESGQPSQWDSYKITIANGSYMAIISNIGLNGTPALKIGYMLTQGQASAIGLGTHLTGNLNTGYSELYMRYVVKFDDNWISGDGRQNYWKWFRLHQYRPTSNINAYGENDGLGDTRYLVGVWASNPPTFEVMASSNVNHTSGSAGGPHTAPGFSGTNTCSTCGHFESMPGWNFDSSGYWTSTPQTWHTVEFHIKLNTGGDCDGTENGVLEMWLDGIEQTQSLRYSKRNGETKTCIALPTQKYQGGINYLKVFDNLADWTKSWGSTQRYVYLDSIKISDVYIGPESVPVGGYSQANVIPASQVDQATDGSGTITINSKALDGSAGTITLSTFEYSTDGGSTWTAPTNEDSSAALSSNWDDNSYSSSQYSVVNGTSSEWSAATAYSFTLNTKHTDVTPLNQYEGNVKFRFYVNNGNPTISNNPLQTASFSLDNMPPAKIDPVPSIN